MTRLTVALLVLGCAGCVSQPQIAGPIRFDGAVFEYSAEGHGPPVVVFTGSVNIGQLLYTDQLRTHLTLIHADPAHLGGERLTALTMDTVVDDIERLRQKLGVDRIGVMGHSMFGPVALEYALKYPDHAHWAILTGALPYTTARAFRASEEYWATQASAERKAIRAANQKALSEQNAAGKSASERFWDAYEADVPFRFYDARWDLRAFRRGLSTQTNMEFVNHFWGVVLKDFDHTSAYGRIRVPVLVIAGKYDFGAPHFLWNDVGAVMPDFTFQLFENAGHNPMLETPEEFDRVLTVWIASRR